MNRQSPLTKASKHAPNFSPPRIIQTSVCTTDNGIFSQNGSNKIKVIKFESMSSQQLKRRRSRSHNAMEYTDDSLFNVDNNYLPFSFYTDETNGACTRFHNNSSHVENQWTKEKHKKDTHNRVERKRRDFINKQIQKLADLLPSELLLNCELKMNKGVILKNSVEYISSMKCVQELNQQLIRENELGSRLIRHLVALKDRNCSMPSLDENIYGKFSGDKVDMYTLLNEWQTVHDENKELVQQFSIRLSNTFSESRNEINYEDMFNLDVTNNNPVHISIPSRKRYSSMPTNISSPSNGFPSSTFNVTDKGASILNSLLKKAEMYHFPSNKSNKSTFNMENIDDSINSYLECSNNSIVDDDVNTETGVTEDPNPTITGLNENYFEIQDKMYYIFPKSARSNSNGEVNSCVAIQPLPDNNNHDPMLLSDNALFGNGDR